MGNRLSRIYTRTGDDGTTGLGDGTRLRKDHPRIEAIGNIDELNSALGTVLGYEIPAELGDGFEHIQHVLFDLGGELSIPDHPVLTAEHTQRLETLLDTLNLDLPMLKEFILPAGGLASSHCHLARSICRRAERRCWTLADIETVNPHSLVYLNRLSDLLFVACRIITRHEHGSEVYWHAPEL